MSRSKTEAVQTRGQGAKPHRSAKPNRATARTRKAKEFDREDLQKKIQKDVKMMIIGHRTVRQAIDLYPGLTKITRKTSKIPHNRVQVPSKIEHHPPDALAQGAHGAHHPPFIQTHQTLRNIRQHRLHPVRRTDFCYK